MPTSCRSCLAQALAIIHASAGAFFYLYVIIVTTPRGQTLIWMLRACGIRWNGVSGDHDGPAELPLSPCPATDFSGYPRHCAHAWPRPTLRARLCGS